jgi:hypothetical protein
MTSRPWTGKSLTFLYAVNQRKRGKNLYSVHAVILTDNSLAPKSVIYNNLTEILKNPRPGGSKIKCIQKY